MAMPNPMPVLIVSSRARNAPRTVSRSASLIWLLATRRFTSSTIADHRSVEVISGRIWSLDKRLPSVIVGFSAWLGAEIVATVAIRLRAPSANAVVGLLSFVCVVLAKERTETGFEAREKHFNFLKGCKDRDRNISRR